MEFICFHMELQRELIKIRNVFLKLSGSFILFHKIQCLKNAILPHYIGYLFNAFDNEGVLVDVLNRNLKAVSKDGFMRLVNRTHFEQKPNSSARSPGVARIIFSNKRCLLQ